MATDVAAPGALPPPRLADWRLLVAPPAAARHRRVAALGGPAGHADLLRALDVADEVTTTLPTDGSAQVVVALPPALPAAAALAAALAPGGALYLEVDRRAAGRRRESARRVVARLRRAGLAVTGVYATLPSPADRPRRLVPLDLPAAVRWYFASVYRPLSPLQRLAAALVPTVLARGGALARLAPSFAVTARAPGGPGGEAAHARLPAPGGGSAARAVVLADGGDRVVLLPFAPGDRAPRAVLKAPRSPAFEARTRDERDRVRAVRALLPAELRRAVPEPAAPGRAGPFLVAVEGAAPGRSLLASSGGWGAPRRRRLDDLRLAMDWLARFHLATVQSRAGWGAAERERWLEAPIAAYAARFGETDAERRLFAAARRHADGVAGAPVPEVWQHGDYAVWNLLRAGDDLHVLDWEGAAPGPALCDALHLATSWDLAIRRPRTPAGELQAFRRLFLAPAADPYAAAAHAALARYRAALGVGDGVQPLLLLHHRLELALRRDRQRRDAGDAGDARAGNAPVAYVALLAEHAAALFGAADAPTPLVRRPAAAR